MATRFFFPLNEAAAVSPAFDAGWEDTDEAMRRRLSQTKGASAITIGTRIDWTAGNDALDRQYVSDPMNSGIQIDGQTYKCQLMTREYALADNSTSRIAVKIYNREGTVEQFLIVGPSQRGPATEYVNNVSHRNKTFADGDIIAGAYTTAQGDRLVVEIGHSDAAGTTPEGSCKFGENATDLPENETQTADGAGWFEMSGTLTFEGPSAVLKDPIGVGVVPFPR